LSVATIAPAGAIGKGRSLRPGARPSRGSEQGLRAEAAEERRRRILEALYERLRAEPSRPVSVDEVARLARVARLTVYLIFGSRAGLFDALAADLFRSGEFAVVEQAAANPDAREHLRGGVVGGSQYGERARSLPLT
jgi:AcrR family transcriptional regulator